jgi:RNA-binding protein 5/10
LAAALLSFLLSPQSQPHGFLIANRPIATSFADPASFEAAPPDQLGGQFLLRATSNGGIGSETKDQSEGGWCVYANEQAGAIETVPVKGSIPDNGVLPEVTPQLRSFLGNYAGKVDQVEEKAPAGPVGGMVNIANVVHPIKTFKKEPIRG